MDVTPRVSFALLVLLTESVAAPPYVGAQTFLCSSIRVGDTAPALALRLTGHPANRHEPWFQIADPATGRLVPKSQYAVLRADWRVCLAAEIATSPTRAGSAGGARQSASRADVGFAFRVGLSTFMILLSWSLVDRCLRQARPIPANVREAAEQFVNAFARPLLDQPFSTGPPIRARLRFAPEREELEILIAPTAGRRYPNLSDHKSNVEYDVARVLRILDHSLMLSNHLRAEGPWVVIPVRPHADVKEAGAT